MHRQQKELAQQIGTSNDLSTILGNLISSFSPSRQKLSGAGESLRGRSFSIAFQRRL